MGEIRIVGLGKTRGYLYPVCKKHLVLIEDVCIPYPDASKCCYFWLDIDCLYTVTRKHNDIRSFLMELADFS